MKLFFYYLFDGASNTFNNDYLLSPYFIDYLLSVIIIFYGSDLAVSG